MRAEDGLGALQSCFCDTDEYERLKDRCCAQLSIKIHCSIRIHIINTLKRNKVCLQLSPRLYLGQATFFFFFTFLQQMEVEQ